MIFIVVFDGMVDHQAAFSDPTIFSFTAVLLSLFNFGFAVSQLHMSLSLAIWALRAFGSFAHLLGGHCALMM